MHRTPNTNRTSNAINDPKYNKVPNVITFCPNCNKVLDVITICPECNKLLNNQLHQISVAFGRES